jgi:arachidonate 15-lipoxygenase
MGTKRYWFGLTNTVWKSLEVIAVKWNPYDYEAGASPKAMEGWKLAKGESKKTYLEVYNGANGARFSVTLKVEGDWTFTVSTDPREQANDKLANGTLIPTKGAPQDPPVVYANLKPEWGDHGGVEYVVAEQQDGLLVSNGDLDSRKYKTWAAGIKPDYYAHKFVNDLIPVAIKPVDDRDEGGTSAYSVQRNANVMFAKFLADTVLWEADRFGASSNFWKTLPTPLGATPRLYEDDRSFANFVLSGPDPSTIELVRNASALPPSLQGDASAALEAQGRLPRGFDAALQEGRVFHIDFSRYRPVASPGRYSSWPHAVFLAKPTTNSMGSADHTLMPVAIELNLPGRSAGSPVTVFAANNDDVGTGCSWETAKRVFLTAAANYHELGTHLGRCHLTMERYALATYRHLPPWHPVGRLLRPHFKFMVATNHDAFDNLVNPDGPVDRNFMASVDRLLNVTYDAFQTWDLKLHGGLESDLDRRGLLADDSKLPHGWHYKSMGLPIYRAIKTYVTSYLRLWYAANGAAYREDIGLQSWRAALRTDYRAPSLMDAGASFEDLVTACTNIIWTCGPQHSAVNYSQYDYLGDANTIPFSVRLTPEAKPFEPTRAQVGAQAEVISRLSLYRYDQLGEYSTASFLTEYGDLGAPNAPWKLVIDRFRDELKEMNWQLRQKDVLFAYHFLAPANITNGISI